MRRSIAPVTLARLIGLLSLLIVGSTQTQAASSGVLAKRAQIHMGTLVTVTAVASSEAVAQSAVSAAFREIHRLEELLSSWIPTSDLSRVNRAAGREPVKVSPETLMLLKRSLQVAELTDGAFNIAIGPAVDAWGLMEGERIPADAELEQLKALTDLSQIQLDERAGTIYLTRKGMRLDVGGIGKGFAADLAVQVMRSVGASAGVVALSGDIRTFGQVPDGQLFWFGIQHPRKEAAILATLTLQDEAISTAGDYQRYFERGGIRYHHILDPRTLKPARECQSVTVIASEGTLADGLDTGIFVMGPERGMELVERLPGVEAVIVDEGGTVLVSSGLKNRLELGERPR